MISNSKNTFQDIRCAIVKQEVFMHFGWNWPSAAKSKFGEKMVLDLEVNPKKVSFLK